MENNFQREAKVEGEAAVTDYQAESYHDGNLCDFVKVNSEIISDLDSKILEINNKQPSVLCLCSKQHFQT